MSRMFENCSALNELDISSFDISNANFSDMLTGTKWESVYTLDYYDELWK